MENTKTVKDPDKDEKRIKRDEVDVAD